jgi:predicted transcriptional regulator
MRRTTVKISDELDALLRQEAELRGRTISEVTRLALEAFLGVGPRRRLRAGGAGRSGASETSERIEEILRQEVSR